MKKLSIILLGMSLLAGTFFTSCRKDDGEVYTTALVTVKPNADNTSVYLQLDDNTALLPVNISSSPFGNEEVRALTSYRKAKDSEMKAVGTTMQQVYVNYLDKILTKDTAENLGAEQNAITYGIDPVEIVNDWVTIAEDGYLTLRFRTYWGGVSTHMVNLVYDGTEENPYHVTFYHNANNDVMGRLGDGLAAFRLSELPDTEGKTVDLTLEWNSFTGTKVAVFKYCTRASTNASTNAFGVDFEDTVE